MSGESPAPNGATDNRDPSGFLSEIINRPVTVKLNSGVVYKGAFGFVVRADTSHTDNGMRRRATVC